jgi:hypothetical protein
MVPTTGRIPCLSGYFLKRTPLHGKKPCTLAGVEKAKKNAKSCSMAGNPGLSGGHRWSKMQGVKKGGENNRNFLKKISEIFPGSDENGSREAFLRVRHRYQAKYRSHPGGGYTNQPPAKFSPPTHPPPP